jgi:hypothetical protein
VPNPRSPFVALHSSVVRLPETEYGSPSHYLNNFNMLVDKPVSGLRCELLSDKLLVTREKIEHLKVPPFLGQRRVICNNSSYILVLLTVNLMVVTPMISRLLRSCGASLVLFASWLVTLLIPSTAWGQGNFLPGVSIHVNPTPESVAVGDINGDKMPDLVVAQASSGVGILLGNGDGTFQAETIIDVLTTSPPCSPYGVAIGDFNGDGFLDLACSVKISYLKASLPITDPSRYYLAMVTRHSRRRSYIPSMGCVHCRFSSPTLIMTRDSTWRSSTWEATTLPSSWAMETVPLGPLLTMPCQAVRNRTPWQLATSMATGVPTSPFPA